MLKLYHMYISRQYLLIGSKKHAYVSPDSINEIKKAVIITLLFLQLKCNVRKFLVEMFQ